MCFYVGFFENIKYLVGRMRKHKVIEADKTLRSLESSMSLKIKMFPWTVNKYKFALRIIYVYMSVCVCVCVCLYVWECVCMWIYVCASVCVYVCDCWGGKNPDSKF